MDKAIEVVSLTKRYGSFTAVENLSFSVRRGEILGLAVTPAVRRRMQTSAIPE